MENYFNRILENNSIPKQIRETVCSEMHHALEVSNMAVLISKELGKDEKFCDDIAVAGVLHDIGKLNGLTGMSIQMMSERHACCRADEVCKNAFSIQP